MSSFRPKRVLIEKTVPELMIECAEHPQGIEWIIGCVNEDLGLPNRVENKTKEQKELLFMQTLSLIYYLLRYREMKVGQYHLKDRIEWFSSEGEPLRRRVSFGDKELIFWDVTPEDAVERIAKEWAALGRNPTPFDDIAWFALEGAV